MEGAGGVVTRRDVYMFGRVLGFVWAYNGTRLVLALIASDRQMRW